MQRLPTLAVANLVFIVANVLHSLDHMRQGTGRLTTEVMAGGTVLTLLAFATLPLMVRRHARAPLVAAAVGLWSAAGVAASHLAPHWSAFSDPYPDLSLDTLSWAVMLAEIAAALVFGLLGVRELRRQGAGSAPAVPRAV